MCSTAPLGEEGLDEARTSGTTFTIYCAFHIVTAVIPSFVLYRAVQKKINRLDNNQAASSNFADSVMHDLDVSVSKPGEESSIVELPRDRPFANLALIPTTFMPPRFQDILQTSMQPIEKAKRLRIALRRDYLALSGYLMLLLTTGSLTAFAAFDGLRGLTPKQNLIVCVSWNLWSFDVPVLFVAAGFLYTCIYHQVSDDGSAQDVQLMSSRFKPPVAAITLQQTVEVEVEEEVQIEEKTRYPKEGLGRSW